MAWVFHLLHWWLRVAEDIASLQLFHAKQCENYPANGHWMVVKKTSEERAGWGGMEIRHGALATYASQTY